MTDFEVSGLNEVAKDLGDAPGRVQRRVDGIVNKGASNMVKDWRQRASGMRHAPAYPRSITFDSDWEGSAYVAEIGPDRALAQGPLGDLIERGSANNPPHGNDVAVADAEAPRFERAIADLGGAL